MKRIYYLLVICCLIISGCARWASVFAEDDECICMVKVVSLPGKQKKMNFMAGLGSSEFAADLSNGILASVGQMSNSKIPETLTSAAKVAPTVFAPLLEGDRGYGDKPKCEPSAVLFPI